MIVQYDVSAMKGLCLGAAFYSFIRHERVHNAVIEAAYHLANEGSIRSPLACQDLSNAKLAGDIKGVDRYCDSQAAWRRVKAGRRVIGGFMGPAGDS